MPLAQAGIPKKPENRLTSSKQQAIIPNPAGGEPSLILTA